MNKFTTTIIIFLLAFIGYGLFPRPQQEQVQPEPEVIYKTRTIETDKSLGDKINTLKSNLMDDLKQCESGNFTDDDALMTFDPRQSDKASCSTIGARAHKCFSYGQYQFKIGTVQYYSEKLRGETLTNKQALDLAMNYEQARQLASEIVWDEVGGIWNWKNCADKIGAKERIESVRYLES